MSKGIPTSFFGIRNRNAPIQPDMSGIAAACAMVVQGMNIPTLVTIVRPNKPAEPTETTYGVGTRVRFLNDDIKPQGDYEVTGTYQPGKDYLLCYRVTRVRKDGKGLTKDRSTVGVGAVEDAVKAGIAAIVE
jgi:hypothetical protein